MRELAARGSAQTKKTFLRHGAQEPFDGVKVADLKVLQKRIKVDQPLALALYATGHSDAMYLAGLIADPAKFTKRELDQWAKGAYWYMLSGYTVPWVAAESPHGLAMARKWIDAKSEQVANAGWSTWCSLVALLPDDQLDLDELRGLLKRVETTIAAERNRVRAAMNMFVISVGCYVVPLTATAIATAKRVGKVEVDVGDTDCKIPDAVAYIDKVRAMGKLGKKRQAARC